MQHNRTSHVAVAAEIRLSTASSLQTRLSLFPSRASLEVGLAHASPLTSGYAGVAYGGLGTTAVVRLSRAGHSLHLPLHLADHYQDWRTLLVAVALPLTVNLVATQYASSTLSDAVKPTNALRLCMWPCAALYKLFYLMTTAFLLSSWRVVSQMNLSTCPVQETLCCQRLRKAMLHPGCPSLKPHPVI